MEIKTVPIGKIKAGPDSGLKKGQMMAYASVFDVVDSYGDVVVKGAFANSLADWRAKSGTRTMPLLYGHNFGDPKMNVGAVIAAEEDDRGLKITAEFDDDETAQKVYRLVKSGRIAELSFAYETVKQAFIDDEERPKAVRELQELKILECSVVPIGANSETEVLAIKSLGALDRIVTDVKAGRTLSKANEAALRDALDGITTAKERLETVLPKAEPEEDETEDDDDSAKSGVSSGGRDAELSDDTAPGSGGDEAAVKALAEAVTPLVEAALMATLKAAGISLPSDTPTAAKSPDLLVTEVQLLELADPSE